MTIQCNPHEILIVSHRKFMNDITDISKFCLKKDTLNLLRSFETFVNSPLNEENKSESEPISQNHFN